LIWERDLIRFSNQPIGGKYVENPGPDKLQHVFDMIKELVYREPFLDTIIKIRDLKLIIEDPQEASDRGLIKADKPLDLSLL
jgi:hypothetical protein